MRLYFPNYISLFLITLHKGDAGADPLRSVTLLAPSKPVQEGYSS